MALLGVMAGTSGAAPGDTTRVSVDSSGSQANNGSNDHSSISSDGRYVVFTSSASNLVTDDRNGLDDVFVYDRQTKATQRVSVIGGRQQLNHGAHDGSISSNGRYVTNEVDDWYVASIFVYDRQTGTTELVSVDSSGNQGDLGSYFPSISSDGRYVAFTSFARNLVVGDDTWGDPDAYVHDRDTGTTQLVSVDSSGSLANGESGSPSISSDGRYAAFYSHASKLVEDDTNSQPDIFVHERATTTQTSDCTAPTTTASATTGSGVAYEPNTWSDENVKVTISTQDNEGGSGIKDIRYSATGAQSFAETNYDLQNPPTINTDGITTISYYATDNAGNRELPANTFTVKLDKSVPTLDIDNTDGSDGVSPDNGATGVLLDTNVEATFSEAIDTGTLWINFTLAKKDSSTPVAGTVTYYHSPNKATFDPSADLASGTTYTATIKGGDSGAKDLAGNALEQDYSWSFTTTAPGCTKSGTSANDTISGTSGKDVICDLGGNDTIKGLGGDDILIGGGNDILIGGGNDKLIGGTGNDILDGGLGTDTVSFAPSLTAVNASLATNTATGEGSDTFAGVENLTGSSKTDTLTGSGANNTLTGGGGADTVRGGAGNDKVVGSGGADSLFGEGGNDTVNSKDGVNGNDSLDGGIGTDTKVADATEKSITGFP